MLSNTPKISLQTTDPELNPLLDGIIRGDTSGLSKQTYQDFLDSGLLHLISASGGNILLLLTITSYILLFIPIKQRNFIQVLCVISYAIGVGNNISFLRACIAYILGRVLTPSGYRGFGVSRIIASVYILYLYNPLLIISSWGLLFSVAGVFGLIHTPYISSHLAKPGISHLWSSIIASYALLGPLLLLSGSVNILSPLLTVFATPIISCILILYGIFLVVGNNTFLNIFLGLLEKLASRGAEYGLFLKLPYSQSVLYLIRILTRIILVISYYRTRNYYFTYDIRD